MAGRVGAYRVDPIRAFWGPKPRGGFRRFAVLSRRDERRWEALGGRVAAFVEPRLLRGVVANRAVRAPNGWRLEDTGAALRRARALAPTQGLVLHTDIEDFYPSVSPLVLARALEDADVAPDLSRGVATMLEGWGEARYPGLPVGPPASAILANAVLRAVDDAVGSPFIRWVDDYVIPIPSEQVAAQALERIDTALTSLGLRRSTVKTEIQDGLSGIAWLPSARHLAHPIKA